MKIINFNNTNHTIRLIPRYYPTGLLTINLWNEIKAETTIINGTYILSNGYLDFSFTFVFVNKDRYSFKVMENNNVVYRGKIYSTIEDTQDYKQSTYLYEY